MRQDSYLLNLANDYKVKMWRSIVEHTLPEYRNTLQLLENGYYPNCELLPVERSTVYLHNNDMRSKDMPLMRDKKRETNYSQTVIVDNLELSIELSESTLILSILNTDKEENTIYTYSYGKLIKKDHGIHYIPKHVIEYNNDGKPILITYNNYDLVITLDYKGYEKLYNDLKDDNSEYQYLTNGNRDEDDEDDEDDDIEENEYKLNDVTIRNVCDTEFQSKKLLEGIFIDPYIDKDGQQNFRCILRRKPFKDTRGDPISMEKRQLLREELNKLTLDHKNYCLDRLLDFN